MALFTLRLALLCCLVYLSVAERDFDVCDIPTHSYGLIPPSIPRNFEMKQGKTNTLKKSVSWEEYYFDDTNLKAKYVLLSNGIERHYIFDYETGQIIEYYQLNPGMDIRKDILSTTCKAVDMDRSNMRHIFGYKNSEDLTEHSRMYTSEEVLRFGGIYKYAANGESLLEERNLAVNEFVGCVYDFASDVTANTTFYFSSEAYIPSGSYDKEIDAEMNANYFSLPAGYKANGVYGENKTKFDVTTSITWFRGEPNFNYDTFKIPLNMYCDGFRGSKPMPKLPSEFLTRIETTIYSRDELGKIPAPAIVYYTQVFYNYQQKLARRDFTPLPGKDGEIITFFKNNGSVSQIFDFNDGTLYTIHKNSGRCFTKSIDPGSYFEKAGQSVWIMMATPEEFFQLNLKSTEYKGKYFTRAIETDVWEAKFKRNNISVFQETHFTTDGWHEDVEEIAQYDAPIRQTFIEEANINGELVNSVTENNFFQFKAAEPPLFLFETRQCVEELKHKFLVITLSLAPKDEEIINSNLRIFLQDMQYYIAKLSKIGSPLRVQRLQLQNSKGQYFLIFAFIGRSISRTGVAEPGISVEKAIEYLVSFVDEGKFELRFVFPGSTEEKRVTGNGIFEIPETDDKAIVKLTNKKQVVHPRLRPINVESYAYWYDESKKEESKAKKGMSPGGLAGLAIGMLIIGAGLGVGVMCFYMRRSANGGQMLFGMKG